MEKDKKKSYRNNEFKKAPTRNEKFELPGGSNSVSDIQDYFEYIIKKHEKLTDNLENIENRITFKIKREYYLELLDKNGENVTHLEITEVVLVQILSIMIINAI